MSNKEFYDSWKQEHIDNPEFTKVLPYYTEYV
jgi:hypothetical protein